jgi:uncharacterized protein
MKSEEKPRKTRNARKKHTYEKIIEICTNMHTIVRVDFEWDEKKANANHRKHGIDFSDVVLVFYDERAVTIRDIAWDEERFVTMGMDALARLLVVCYTWRGIRIRIISARKATREERREYKKAYEEGI